MNYKKNGLIRKAELEAQIKYLQHGVLSHYLSRHELEQMLTHCDIVVFEPNALIIQQGKNTDGFYLIVAGRVDLMARILGKGIQKIETLTVGHFIGAASFIEDAPCATSAVAQEQVECLHITPLYFELLASYFPQTQYKILNAVSVQVCHHLKRIHDKATAFIAHSDMITLSFFGRVIHTLTQPKKLASMSDQEAKTLLQGKPIFQGFTPDDLTVLFAHSTFLEAPKDCILIHEREKNASCFIVLHGAVQSSIMQDNKLAKLSVIGPGSLFASIACVDRNSEFTITFLTCESAVLLKIPEKALNFFEVHHPELWYKLFNLICESLVALSKSINKLDIRLHIEAYNR
ncbi:Crp/Fnr family transcriptional regulator [Legionella oakridgensis]|uniref:cAMP-binding protein n=2 Tax=Legionella oakridgensis TaxID=29423 RepID=W0B9C1_9GAMM|nr:cyclic nucleotide-binding domain-containing protein [Legionella oakridgensis]AHE67148.1 cAMP-binding protein [Legionella oakridgensis ATCC 33761 = DSM 21215]ETO93119.1 cAMP-binding protein, subunit of cAMP-dependent protein kinase [Legionella oakridgensis RV-2-2007]KTD38045.1 cNMP binding domain-containing protein [Legionella oakridgensis]STY20233.1 cNMP binding domain-containing protein [Legionella longbeachae]